MTLSGASHDEIACLMGQVLDQVKGLISAEERNDVAEYLEFGENGVAYELLAHVLANRKVARPDTLSRAGRLMGMGD